MPSFFVEPDSDRLHPFGDSEYWIEVKRTLTAGEERRIATSVFNGGVRQQTREGGEAAGLSFEVDLDLAAFVKVAEYLIDWNLTTREGKTVEIDTRKKRLDALRALDPDVYRQIEQAIDAHVARQAQEKKARNVNAGSKA